MLSLVAVSVAADILIILSDIDGLYDDDPRKNKNARFIPEIEDLTEEIDAYGKKSTGSVGGTGGMATKLKAAHIAVSSGADMIIANAKDLNNIHRIIAGKEIGTYIHAKKSGEFYLPDFLESNIDKFQSNPPLFIMTNTTKPNNEKRFNLYTSNVKDLYFNSLTYFDFSVVRIEKEQ